LRSMAVLPVIVAIVFALIALRDRAHGGYRATQLEPHTGHDAFEI
jgi:hypothetical protein